MCFSHAEAPGALSTRLNKSIAAVMGLTMDHHVLNLKPSCSRPPGRYPTWRPPSTHPSPYLTPVGRRPYMGTAAPLHGAACPFWTPPAFAWAGCHSQASNRSKVALPVMAASESLADWVPGGRSTTWITDGRRSIR